MVCFGGFFGWFVLVVFWIVCFGGFWDGLFWLFLDVLLYFLFFCSNKETSAKWKKMTDEQAPTTTTCRLHRKQKNDARGMGWNGVSMFYTVSLCDREKKRFELQQSSNLTFWGSAQKVVLKKISKVENFCLRVLRNPAEETESRGF